jgi:beta-galactosidase
MTRRDLIKTGIAATSSTRFSAAIAQAAQSGASAKPDSRERLLLDFGWRFHLGHASDPAKDFGFGGGGATFAKQGRLAPPAAANFNDSSWKPVDLPHDWAVDLPFIDTPAVNAHGAKPLGRAYPDTSIGWYRRVFDVPASDLGRRLSIEFDGVFRDAIVAINGQFIAHNMSGYAPFRFDISDYANYGGKNVLLVRADATLGEGWFYEGAGIYRHVWLTKTHPVHVSHWGTIVRSEVLPNSARISISTDVNNEGDANSRCRITSTILDSTGATIATLRSDELVVTAGSDRQFEQQASVNQPKLWSIEQPNMYKLSTVVESHGVAVDRYETPFGIRTFRFDPEQGFFLNGKSVKIKGTCNHHDHAGVGAALPDRIQYYRIERLKEMGSNAYRTSHNPPTPELLDACDQLGMIVIDETRMASASEEGLSQLERMIRRDRNHPSVVAWSLSNEEPIQGNETGARVGATMKRLANRLDPTRPIVAAMDNSWGRGLTTVVDIQGFNYRDPQMAGFHDQFPAKPIIGSESGSTVSTRGIYENDKPKGYVSAYDVNFPYWASTAETWWKIHAEHPYIAGGFVWTGFDYRGEPTPYGWPCVSSHFGILDTCGFPKDNFYYYKAWWTPEPLLHLFPHWNWSGKEGQEIEVWAHSNLDRVELFLNGKSAGSQNVPRNSHVQWKVKYEPGAIEARGYKGAKQVLTSRRETTGEPAAIVLRPDRTRIAADGEDVSMVAAEVVDAQGRAVPTANHEITFAVTGGRVIGVGNGDPSSHEPDNASKRRAFNGLCMAIVQSAQKAGEIKVEASAPGLRGMSVTIAAVAGQPRPRVA